MSFTYDALVLVGARAPVIGLYHAAKTLNGLPPVACIGDCEAPGLIQAAVLSGHMHARWLVDARPKDEFLRESGGALLV